MTLELTPLELKPVTMELKRLKLKPSGATKPTASTAETPSWPKPDLPGGPDRSPTLLPVLFGPLLASLGPLLAAFGCSWPLLGRSWPFLAALGRSWAALGRS